MCIRDRFETILVVSAKVSPLATEEAEGSVNPKVLPSNRAMALSKDRRVRVLGSKNKVASTFPAQKPDQVAKLDFIWSDKRKSC